MGLLDDALNTRLTGEVDTAHRVTLTATDKPDVGRAGDPALDNAVAAYKVSPHVEDSKIAPAVEYPTGEVMSVWLGPSKDLPRPNYDTDTVLATMHRMSKALTFMLDHFYDDQGVANIGRFIDVAEQMWVLALARQAEIRMSMPTPLSTPATSDAD